MSRLLLVRHAKSDWTTTRHDHDRPLSRRGTAAAHMMGRVLTAAGEVPDLIVSSTALRATTTARLAMEPASWDVTLREDGRLYYASPEQILAVIRETPATVGRLCVVGHQPGFGQAVSLLIGGGTLAVKTASVAGIEFGNGWRHIEPEGGRLAFFFSPRFFRRFHSTQPLPPEDEGQGLIENRGI